MVTPPESFRHGPCRAWHPTGKLRFEGQYERDERVGRWTFYDRSGDISEQGDFVADHRDGPWITRDPATRKQKAIEYIAGRPRPDHDLLMAGIEADLVSGSLRRQVAAIRRLEELGPYGVPLLVELLDSKAAALQLLALRTLAEQPVLPAAADSKLTALSDHASPRIALHALRTSYHAQSGERDEILPRLLSAIESADDEQLAAEILLGMYDTDAQRRPLIMHHLLERLGSVQAQYDARWGGMPADHAAQLAERRWGVLPDLEAGFESANAEGRWFAILVLHLLVAAGPCRQVETSPGVSEVQCEIPAAAEALLQRAKADTDPRVREAAETVGRGSGGFGFGFSGFGGQSGGFF
jgi:hypothetical protein